MNDGTKVREIIQDIAGTKTRSSHFISVEVVSIQGETITVLHGDTQLTDVKLRALVNGNESSIIVNPTIGSIVLCADLSGGELRDLVVIGYSEFDSIVYNKGKFGGLTKTTELKTQLDKLTARVDGIINAIKSPTVIATPQDGGTALLGLLRTEIGKIIDKEDFSNIEDTKIKH